MTYLYIDRVEGDIAVCEAPNGALCEHPLARLPEGAAEGCVLRLHADGRMELDAEETARRRAALRALQRRLFGDE